MFSCWRLGTHPHAGRSPGDEYRNSGWIQSCLEARVGSEAKRRSKAPGNLQRRAPAECESFDTNNRSLFRPRRKPKPVTLVCEDEFIPLHCRLWLSDGPGQEICLSTHLADQDQLS